VDTPLLAPVIDSSKSFYRRNFPVHWLWPPVDRTQKVPIPTFYVTAVSGIGVTAEAQEVTEKQKGMNQAKLFIPLDGMRKGGQRRYSFGHPFQGFGFFNGTAGVPTHPEKHVAQHVYFVKTKVFWSELPF